MQSDRFAPRGETVCLCSAAMLRRSLPTWRTAHQVVLARMPHRCIRRAPIPVTARPATMPVEFGNPSAGRVPSCCLPAEHANSRNRTCSEGTMTSVDPSTSSTTPASRRTLARLPRHLTGPQRRMTEGASVPAPRQPDTPAASIGRGQRALPGAGVDARAARRRRAAGRPRALGAAAVARPPRDGAGGAAPAHRGRPVPGAAAPERARRAAGAAGQAAHRGRRDRHGDRDAARAGVGDHLPGERVDRDRPGRGRPGGHHVAGRAGPAAPGDAAPHGAHRRRGARRRAGGDPAPAPALRAGGGGLRRRRRRLRRRGGRPAARRPRRPRRRDPGPRRGRPAHRRRRLRRAQAARHRPHAGRAALRPAGGAAHAPLRDADRPRRPHRLDPGLPGPDPEPARPGAHGQAGVRHRRVRPGAARRRADHGALRARRPDRGRPGRHLPAAARGPGRGRVPVPEAAVDAPGERDRLGHHLVGRHRQPGRPGRSVPAAYLARRAAAAVEHLARRHDPGRARGPSGRTSSTSSPPSTTGTPTGTGCRPG